MPFERQEVGNGGANLGRGHGPDRGNDAMRGEWHIISVRHVGDLAAFEQSAYLLKIGHNYVYRAFFEDFAETVP